MPILTNPREERYCQNRAAGMIHDKAYADAGYNPGSSRNNAWTMSKKPHIQERITEIMAEFAEDNKVTVQDIVRQLDEDRAFAIKCGTASAAVAATMNKAKVLGLVVDKVDNKLSNPDGTLAPREVIIKAG